MSTSMATSAKFTEEELRSAAPSRHIRLTRHAEKLIERGTITVADFCVQLPVDSGGKPHVAGKSQLSTIIRRLLLLTGLCIALLGFSACETLVIHRGETVTNTAQVGAARAIRIADTTAASVVRFLITGHETGVLPLSVLETYERDIADPLQAALDTARKGLERAIATGSIEDQSQLSIHIETLMDVLAKATELASKHGW